jgi:hypothetical protein
MYLYSVIFQDMYTMHNDQIRVIEISMTSNIYHLRYKQSKFSVLAILKHPPYFCTSLLSRTCS